MSKEISRYTYGCLHVGRFPGPPNGDLDRAVWKDIPTTSDFVLAMDGQRPTQRTWAKACWDDTALHVAFWCEDVDIWNDMTERDDFVWKQETAEVFLVPGLDATWYYEFQFSPRNVVRDVLVHNPTGRREDYVFDGSWNCEGLETAVQVRGTLDDRSDRDEGWSLEVCIPFRALDLRSGRPPEDGEEWLFNLQRIDRAPVEEFCAWSPTFRRPVDFHYPPRFGRLRFVR